MNLFLSSRSDRGFLVLKCPRERFLDLEPFSPFVGSSTCSKSEIERCNFDKPITIVDDDDDTETEEEDIVPNLEEVIDDVVEAIITIDTNEESDSLIDAEKNKHLTTSFEVLLLR